ncbi:unnamed protein product [Amoebophrya sp. A25]|nr:unnamed protein product [Amoebophrya sp. A25]|eukprot:GSA25T00020396001.1
MVKKKMAKASKKGTAGSSAVSTKKGPKEKQASGGSRSPPIVPAVAGHEHDEVFANPVLDHAKDHPEQTALDTCMRPFEKRARFNYANSHPFKLQHHKTALNKNIGCIGSASSSSSTSQSSSTTRGIPGIPTSLDSRRRFSFTDAKSGRVMYDIEGDFYGLGVFVRDHETQEVISIMCRPTSYDQTNSTYVWLPIRSYKGQEPEASENMPLFLKKWLEEQQQKAGKEGEEGKDESAESSGAPPMKKRRTTTTSSSSTSSSTAAATSGSSFRKFYLHAKIDFKPEKKNGASTYRIYQNNKNGGQAEMFNHSHMMALLRADLVHDEFAGLLEGSNVGKRFAAGRRMFKLFRPWHPSLMINPPEGDICGCMEIQDDETAFVNLAPVLCGNAIDGDGRRGGEGKEEGENNPADMDFLRLFLQSFCLYDQVLAQKNNAIRRVETTVAASLGAVAYSAWSLNSTPIAIIHDGYLLASQGLFTGVGAVAGGAFTMYQIGKMALYGATTTTEVVHAVGAEPLLPMVGAFGSSVYLANTLVVQPVLKPLATVLKPVVEKAVVPALAVAAQKLTQYYQEHVLRPRVPPPL